MSIYLIYTPTNSGQPYQGIVKIAISCHIYQVFSLQRGWPATSNLGDLTSSNLKSHGPKQASLWDPLKAIRICKVRHLWWQQVRLLCGTAALQRSLSQG